MIERNGIVGYGEASPNNRYDETPEKVIAYFEELPAAFFDEITSADEIPNALERIKLNPVESARVAIEMAWLDWWAKSNNQPLWKLWGETTSVGPVTSYTIGIDTPEVMQKKVLEAERYPLYKIKLGTKSDRQIIAAIREVTDKPLRVDANEGWKTLEQAKREIEFLTTQNVELIEQPMPALDFENMKKLRKWSPLPCVADESFKGTEDLNAIAEAFDIINIKLMKMGSLVKARKVIEKAHQLGLKVMIGCMIESSLANAAGAVIALNAEYSDLDGHLLIENDPFSGLRVNKKCRVVLSKRHGLGVQEIDGLFSG